MATKVTFSKASAVRDRFTVSTAERTQQLVDMTVKKTDQMLRAHFEKRLAAGEDPYPPPNRQIEMVVLSATDFASGNHPDAQVAWEKLSSASAEGAHLIREVLQELKDAGFTASAKLDDASRSVKIVVSDPKFDAWASTHDVERAAIQQVSAKVIEEAAAELGPSYAQLSKDAIRAQGATPRGGHLNVDIKSHPRLRSLDSELAPRIAQASIELALKGVDENVVRAYHDFAYERIVVDAGGDAARLKRFIDG